VVPNTLLVPARGNGILKKRIVCFGELLLRLASHGRELLLQSPSLQVHVGGAEANTAVSLCYLGHDAAVVSAVPDNSLGHSCVGELRRHGVDASGIQFLPGRMGLYFLTQGAVQRPAEVLYDRAGSAFAEANATVHDWPALLRGAEWLHVSGITPAVSGNAAQAARLAMQSARQLGLRISFDCNFRSRVWAQRAHEAPVLLRELAQHADLLFADSRDIAFICNSSLAGADEQQADAAAKLAFATLPKLRWLANTHRQRSMVDTQELSASLRSKNHTFKSRNHALSGIVDRIGSGDAFAAALIDQFLAAPNSPEDSTDLQAAVEFACAAACLKHSIPGDFNLSSRADIAAVLAEPLTDVRR
jgi:2-dehydro-3-deoxygluconokinase